VSLEGFKDKVYYFNPFTFNYTDEEYKFSLFETNRKNKVTDKRFKVSEELGTFMHMASFQKGFGAGYDLMFVNRFDFNIHNLSDGRAYELVFEGSETSEQLMKKALLSNDLSIIADSPFASSIGKIVNNKDIVFVNYKMGRTFNFLFFDKVYGEILLHGKSYSVFSEELLKKGIAFFDLPFTASNEKFVSVISAEQLVELKPLFEKFKDDIQCYDQFININYDDNPVIALYSLKF